VFKKFSYIFVVFTGLFFILIYFFYQKSNEIVIKNSEKSIEELLLNYNSIRDYVSNYQKEEIYKLQENDTLSHDYFNPILLSSTFSAKMVNQIYNEKRLAKGLDPIEIKFASAHPRNPLNQATPLEAKLLQQFNNNEITKYSQRIAKDGKPYLMYAVATKRTTKTCMKCHNDPKNAPKGLVDIYGDTNGFWEKEGDMRAILVTIYPLEEEIKSINTTLYWAYLATFIVFTILLILVYKFMQKIEKKNLKLEALNNSLDKIVQKRTSELDIEKNYLKTILDTNPNIIIVTNGLMIQSANRSFFQFFGYENLEGFKKKHSCICDYFKSINNKQVGNDYTIDGVNWISYIMNDVENVHIIELEKDKKTYYFTLGAVYLNEVDLLLTLQDITSSKDKERVIIQQSKMASMGEMLSNIAHQWRQPLSMISTLSTGITMQKEYGILTDERLLEAMDKINQSTQFLSGTIDDFTNFFQADKHKKYFKSAPMVEKALKLLHISFKNQPFIIEKEILEENIDGYESELVQVILNLLNNACEILIEREVIVKIIKIKVYKLDNTVVISVHDNGGGIPADIKDKVFEPYFTTKHKAQGTGIGLYTSYELIHLHMDGNIMVENELLSYGNKEYFGANFKISIPQKETEKNDKDE
jgi:signal transduction histidine kinase